MRFSKESGFTLIELTVVLAVAVILATIVFSFFYKLEDNKALSADAASVASILSDARARTLAAENDSQFGVHFDANKVTLFQGATYSATDPANVVTTLTSHVTLSAAITGGGSDLAFERLTGEAASSTITIALVSSSSVTRRITVSGLGVIELH